MAAAAQRLLVERVPARNRHGGAGVDEVETGRDERQRQLAAQLAREAQLGGSIDLAVQQRQVRLERLGGGAAEHFLGDPVRLQQLGARLDQGVEAAEVVV